MATLGAVHPYGHLLRSVSAARTGLTYVPRRTLAYTLPHRAASDGPNNDNKQPDAASSPSALSSIKNFFFGGNKPGPKPTARRSSAPSKREGSLSADSIFAEDEATPKLIAGGRTPSGRRPRLDGEEVEEEAISLEQRNRESMQRVLDPMPRARLRWERKMVVKDVRRRGRLSAKQVIMRTERESTSKSHWFKTSVKKLGPLARQIAGKNIDDAILQMRLSKKLAAKDVLKHLEHAKNTAIVRSGMGLGTPDGQPAPKPVSITLPDGQRKTITDPTSIYISQAWVNRGPYGIDYDHRARGQINLLRPPYTGITVILKEEKTRIREWQDREAKDLRKRKAQLWVQLPDRKITVQHQYNTW
ncbi:mitochondrial ribosomal protein subunit L22 [Aspergillus heteromorphus CBS 117.55]|uniref:Mitochondrial ribosomal protein subunit L22 n=1 Tax=Aspergillus heteromorphus CBS 117.55 TaxID=1448321 RepID=A0A317WX08_9EURO|nr:mitochondrial ribosomal protein subunit L22 [Aspergillus heteromorphus CBS 117.55]PWY90919.1 mitochondrial ribosomal protein subunit L22 [Aspergillus heteromorphus CBS 117.55]